MRLVWDASSIHLSSPIAGRDGLCPFALGRDALDNELTNALQTKYCGAALASRLYSKLEYVLLHAFCDFTSGWCLVHFVRCDARGTHVIVICVMCGMLFLFSLRVLRSQATSSCLSQAYFNAHGRCW